MTGPVESPSSGRMPGAILFVCGMNVIRSPIAEALARLMLPARVYVASAGVRAGEPDPFVDVVLDEVGAPPGRGKPRTLEELADDYFDLVVTLSPEAHHTALEMTRSSAVDVWYWPMPDPTVTTGTREQIMAAYRDVRERLRERISSRFLKAGAENATD